MIQLIDNGPHDSMIRFTPRSRYRTTVEPLELELFYGYKCPSCNNITQAMFQTEKEVDLEKYEETIVLSQGQTNGGEILKVIPNPDEPEGNYKTEFFRTQAGNAMRITLKNHVINWLGAKDRKDYFEKGERCCWYTSLISISNEDLIRDLAIVAEYDLNVTKRLNMASPSVSFLANYLKTAMSYQTLGCTILNPVGFAPPSILIKREVMKNRFSIVLSTLYDAWDKSIEGMAAEAEFKAERQLEQELLQQKENEYVGV